jgi:hypothetical protein
MYGMPASNPYAGQGQYQRQGYPVMGFQHPPTGFQYPATGIPNNVNAFPELVKGGQEYDPLAAKPLGIGSDDFPLLSPGLAKTFPTAFLMFCFGVFAVPIAIVLHTGGDPTVNYFVAHYRSSVLILPVVFVIAYLLHLNNGGQPNRIVITATLIFSCIFLLVLSEVYLIETFHKAPLLASTDCNIMEQKIELQQEWQDARGFYATCVAQKASSEGISFAAAVTSYRMEDCNEYNTEVKKHPAWEYLAALEQNQRCAGWCQEQPPMWTRDKTFDACSQVAAQILMDTVSWSMKQVIFYTLFTLMVISVILIGIHSLLAKLHIEW